MNEWTHLETLIELRGAGTPFVEVTMVDAQGSTPQDAGSRMVVTTDGLVNGTVGGGKIEAKAIDLARQMLAERTRRTHFVEWNLQKDVGMTCGGVVRLYFECVNVLDWNVVIFGAGHVTQALTRLLLMLPCSLRCIDPRKDWLGKLPAGVRTTCTDDPPAEVAGLGDDSYVLCMTRGHASDLTVLREIFQQRRPFPYIGVIGSKSKAAVLRRELNEAGISDDVAQFHCPVGLPIGTNHPGEIAVSIAAQLIEVRDKAAAPDA